MDYKSTLNMPKSGFPMRAGLPKREPEMLASPPKAAGSRNFCHAHVAAKIR